MAGKILLSLGAPLIAPTESLQGGRGCRQTWKLVILFFLGAASATYFVHVITADAKGSADIVMPAANNAVNETTFVTTAQLALDCRLMYHRYGLTSVPVAWLTCKALLNYFVQTVLFLGWEIFEGREAIVNKCKKPMGFSRMSIAFQVLGQSSAAWAFLKLAAATRFWDSAALLDRFCLLVSQHSASITILVGLSNNVAVSIFYHHHVDAAYNGGLIAKILVVTGIVIGTPLWFSMCYSMWSVQGVLLVIASFGVTVANGVRNSALVARGEHGAKGAFIVYGFMAGFAVSFLAMIWLVIAVDSPHAWLLFVAFVLELAVPLFVIFVLELQFILASEQAEEREKLLEESAKVAMLCAFGIAISMSTITSMVVPASMVEAQTGWRFAAPETFWAKKIGLYAEFTFLEPAETAASAAEHKEKVFSLWLTQFLGWIL